MRYALILLLLLAFCSHAAEAPPYAQLGDAYFRRDVAGIERLRDVATRPVPNESTAEAAHRLYFTAFADWLLSMSVGDSIRSVAAGRRAYTALDQTVALDPSFAHAYVLRGRVAYMLSSQGALTAEERAKYREPYDAAKRLAPDDPLVRMQDAIIEIYMPGRDRARGQEMFRQVIDAIAARAADDPHLAIWLPLSWNWYGTTFLSGDDLEKARSAFEAALKVRPDYAFIRTAMIPMTEVVEAGAPPKFSGDSWTPLVTDAEGDGKSPAMTDLKAVSWRADLKHVWFKLDLGTDVDPDRFGVNLALDVDEDQNTGSGWWAGNTAFKYDRLVTVWVRRGKDGRYRGAVGAADAADIAAGTMVTSPPRTIAFSVDGSKRSILVGVDRKVFGAHKRVPLVATVGTNTDWNDVAPGEGSAILDLTRK